MAKELDDNEEDEGEEEEILVSKADLKSLEEE